MAGERRWDPGSPARRDDQFVRPPAFRDSNESEPLRAERATWHGQGSPGVAFAVGLAVIAAVAAVAFMALSPPAPDLGSAAGGTAVQGGDAGGSLQAPDVASNQTSPAPGLPTAPSAPPLPSLP